MAIDRTDQPDHTDHSVAADYDPWGPAFVADPYPVLERMRKECPVAHNDLFGGLTILTGYNEVSEAARNPGSFSSRRNVLNDLPLDRTGQVLPPVNLDPPEHTRVRRLELPFLNPTAIAAWEAPIRELCARLLDGLEGRTEIDAASEYAQEIPAEITAMLAGVPVEDCGQFRSWLHELLEVGATDYAVAKEATDNILAYTHQLIETHRAAPGDNDLVSYLLKQQAEQEVPITDGEMARMLFHFLLAGIDTAWSSIGSFLLHLATHDDDRRRLAADPSLMPTAIEESLRMYSPVFVARIANEGAEVGGCPVDHGWTVLDFRSANRDDSAFDNADTFVIDREVNRHIAFGVGVHRCVGSNLARLEMRVGAEMWMERFPEFTLTDPGRVTYSAGHVRGPRSVPVRIG